MNCQYPFCKTLHAVSNSRCENVSHVFTRGFPHKLTSLPYHHISNQISFFIYTVCTLSVQNIRNTFLILSCTSFCPQNSLNSLGHGKGVEGVPQGCWPMLTPMLPTVVSSWLVADLDPGPLEPLGLKTAELRGGLPEASLGLDMGR